MNTKPTFSMRIERSTLTALKRIAKAHRRSVSNVAQIMLDKALSAHEEATEEELTRHSLMTAGRDWLDGGE